MNVDARGALRTVLATDLDGTFAHGTAAARDRLVERLAEHPATALIYVTGRTPDTVRALAERASLPQPDVLIADVGTSVLHGLGPARVTAIEEELDRLWPGADAVRARLQDVAELAPQDVDAPRRASYWIEPVRRRAEAHRAGDSDPFAARLEGDPALTPEAEAEAAAVAEGARTRLDGLDVDVLVSANLFLDVLPRGVHKGSTLRRVLRWLEADDEACVVAGDSLNDLTLFQLGLRGIVVGNCEPALRRRVHGLAGIYQAAAHGVDGIAEGLRHHGFLTDDTDRDDHHGG